jgi:hypothetical protein
MDAHLREAARLLRPALGDLVGAGAADYDQRVRSLLERGAAGEDVDDDLAEVLTRSPEVQAWVASVLEDPEHRPPHLQAVTERSYQGPPGKAAPVAAQRYACPVDGDYVWYRPFVGVPVPACPDHDGVVLVRQDGP